MRVARQAAQSMRAFAEVFANPKLRSIQLAGVGSMLGGWAYGVGIAVYAYHAGGARAVGLLCFVRWGLAGLAAPWVALLVDRRSRKRVMVVCDLIRMCFLAGMAAIAAAHGPSLAVFTLCVISSIVSTAFSPAQGALLPALVRTPDELTAANVVMSTVASVGMFAGPALGGLVLALSGPAVVFAVTAGTFLWSALCLLRVPTDTAPTPEEPEAIVPALLGGFRVIAAERGLRLVIGLTGAQTLVAGASEVLLVVVAFRLLHAGNSGVGWLNAAFGVGCLLGVPAVATLAGRKRLAGDFGLGIILWGLPFALVPLWSNLGFVIVLFAICGIGNTLVDVAGLTLLQRTASDAVLGRVFGVLESLILLTLALGALVTPAIVSALGLTGSLIAVGLFLPALLVPFWSGLRAVDASVGVPTEALDVLRGVPIFAPLPAPVLERLARAAAIVTVRAGDVVFAQGERGDRFYAIASGEAIVEIDGSETGRLGSGDFFGEIALLRDVPRTATVRAATDLTLYAIERDDFIAAVTGHAPSLEAADSVVRARMPAGALV
jgi:predicted MFS family arabinose efflux permease